MNVSGRMHAGRCFDLHPEMKREVGVEGSALLPELQEYVRAPRQKSEPSSGGSQGGRTGIYEEH